MPKPASALRLGRLTLPINDIALTRRLKRQLDTLSDTAGATMAKAWQAQGSYKASAQAAWTTKVTPIVKAAQTRAMSAQVAYLEAMLGEKLAFESGAILAAAAIDVTQPFIAYANALSHGLSFEDAVEAGLHRAEGMGQSAVQWAARATNSAADSRVDGWSRVPGGDACDFCITVSGQRYRTAESASFGHLRDRCAVVPIIGARNPGAALNAESA